MNEITFVNPQSLKELTSDNFRNASLFLNVEEAAIRAVAEVESSGNAFLPDGRPKILYEAHVFHRLTKGAHAGARDRNGVALSVPSWDRSLYGASGAHQYERLNDAMALDVDAALQACSWGMFQILGANFVVCGYEDVRAMVQDHVNGVGGHLDAFAGFVKGNKLDDELRRKDWAGFARGYNGPGYAQNQYDQRMAAAYRRLSSGSSSEIDYVKEAQKKLGLPPDGIAGPQTQAAVKKFQREHGLIADGIIGEKTLTEMGILQ